VTFKLTLHPRSLSPIFYEHGHPSGRIVLDDGPGPNDGLEDEQSNTVPRRRKKMNRLMPGEEFDEQLQCGTMFLFGLVSQKRIKGNHLTCPCGGNNGTVAKQNLTWTVIS
jgi:hypothetical protein